MNCLCLHVFVCMCVRDMDGSLGRCAMMHVWRHKDSIVELIDSLHFHWTLEIKFRLSGL